MLLLIHNIICENDNVCIKAEKGSLLEPKRDIPLYLETMATKPVTDVMFIQL
jgi:hypothetical protein